MSWGATEKTFSWAGPRKEISRIANRSVPFSADENPFRCMTSKGKVPPRRKVLSHRSHCGGRNVVVFLGPTFGERPPQGVYSFLVWNTKEFVTVASAQFIASPSLIGDTANSSPLPPQ